LRRRRGNVDPVPMQGYSTREAFGDFGLRKVADYERLPNLDLEDQAHFNIENQPNTFATPKSRPSTLPPTRCYISNGRISKLIHSFALD